MTQQIINVGPAANDGLGDPIRTAFIKTNDNFSQLYSIPQASPPATLEGTVGDFAGMYAYSSAYFYYCFANYTTGNSTIWAQVTQVANIAVSTISDGTSNVKLVGLNGDATININGTSNIAAFRTTGAYITGVVSATGTITGANITGSNVTGTRIVGGNISSTGNIVATANATANNLVAVTSITSGNGMSSTGVYTNITFDDGIVIDYNPATSDARISTGVGDSITFYNNGVGNIAIVSFDSNGNIVTGGTFQSTGNIITNGIISAAGNIITAGYFVGNFVGNVTGNFVIPGSNTQVIFNTSGSADAVGGFTFNKDSNTMIVLGVVSARGNVIAGNVNTGGQITASGNILGSNLNTGNIVSATGNILSAGNISGGNLLTTGILSATGNIYGANLIITGTESDTGNITGGNLLTGGQVSATGNVTGAYFSAQNDINAGGNVSTVGLTGSSVSISGNVTGGNLLTGGEVSATGNITGNYILGNGSQLSGLPATNLIQNGNSNVLVSTTGGNVSINVNGVSPIITVTPLGQNVFGALSASGNVTVANLRTGGSISAAGGVTGASLIGTITTASQTNITAVGTLGSLSVTGNVTAGGYVGAVYTNSIVNTGSNATGNIGSSSLYFNTVFAQATTALYADLAECYLADADYAPGTVLSVGGNNEVTISTTDADALIIGVVSTNPAYKMNSGLTGDHVVAVALTGRVPCRVEGPVTRGAMMVSAGTGRARAEANPAMGTVIGKAVEAFDGDIGTIEIVVGRL